MINVVTLMDDASSENLALKAEHGLSFFIEAGKKKFLFDCGASAATISNAHRLGVDLKSASFTACSHSHYDHAAGFRDMADAGMGEKYSIQERSSLSVSTPLTGSSLPTCHVDLTRNF